MKKDVKGLTARAVEILKENDRGGYCVPTAGLYPFQWNWDAGFTALGWLGHDDTRAWSELELLLRGQWQSGMIPSIVFHQPSDTYFPGPDEWGVSHEPPTTAISQPPVTAFIAAMLYAKTSDHAMAEDKLKAILPQLVLHHRYWFEQRDPDNHGLVVSYHPWESGMDNSPAWDRALERVPRVTRSYTRCDTGHVDSDQRPRPAQYDRYIYLVDFYREKQFDEAAIYRDCPYKVRDISLNSILAYANLALIDLCKKFGYDKDAAWLQEQQQRLEQAIDACWDEEFNIFFNQDAISDDAMRIRTTAGLLPILIPGLAPAKRDKLVATISDWIDKDTYPYGLASTHPEESRYDSKRYWRGPSWFIVNWMIALGLENHGETALAEEIRQLSANCLDEAGFWEYFDPKSGEGCGGDDFSWTAAIALYWILPGEG